MTRVTLADRVIARRRALGLSQRDVARHGGFNPSTVSEIEGGGVANPRSDILYGLAKALEMRMEELMGEPFLRESGPDANREHFTDTDQARYEGYMHGHHDALDQVIGMARKLRRVAGTEE